MSDISTPAHPLDFIVLGTARSGCATMARAINLDPGLFCGNEFFFGLPPERYGQLPMPSAFFAEEHRASTPRNTEDSRLLLSAKQAAGTIITYGNTQQGYFLQLGHLHAALPLLRALCVYRCPRDIAASYDRHAANPQDPWPEGRVGLFALADWMILLARLAEAPDTLAVVDFDAMFATDPTLAERVLHYVGRRAPPRDTLDRFHTQMFARAGTKPWREMRHDAFLGEIGAPAIDRAIAEAGMFGASMLRAQLRDFVSGALARLIGYLGDTVIADARPAEIAWARRWVFVTLAGFDDLGGWAFGLLRPELNQLAARLAAVDLVDGRDDVEGFLRTLRQRGEDADLAGQQLAHANALAAGKQTMAAVAVSRTPAAHAATIARMQVALGQSLLRAGQTAEAVDVLAQAIARGFHGGSAYLAYSRALHREGQTDAARLAADQAIVAAPGNEAARNWRASLGEANNR